MTTPGRSGWWRGSTTSASTGSHRSSDRRMRKRRRSLANGVCRCGSSSLTSRTSRLELEEVVVRRLPPAVIVAQAHRLGLHTSAGHPAQERQRGDEVVGVDEGLDVRRLDDRGVDVGRDDLAPRRHQEHDLGGERAQDLANHLQLVGGPDRDRLGIGHAAHLEDISLGIRVKGSPYPDALDLVPESLLTDRREPAPGQRSAPRSGPKHGQPLGLVAGPEHVVELPGVSPSTPTARPRYWCPGKARRHRGPWPASG